MRSEFHNDDVGYLEWLQRNPDGYVINCAPVARAEYVILHRARCHAITGDPSSGERWTSTYKKGCSDMQIELELWTRSEVGVLPRPCGICL